ncbi:antibiotic biosynthesis monooxygenase [Pseudomaricurvus alkylphenolicus]|uniref:antibiotic biosynthesis monooxygenase family protein n=1 Tax=Pseudomaricurvus alkylphenolicus TaxID=1306991 RepID=UPI0014242748|nr:antibiotic biosynthesis monooxygenase [Pseudomaricurvus alkylphenolicus]NIB44403.1 antibiotic biosynthesis monooxygenase [Pseudomaricurvus alkylphenolicus]
MITVLIERNIAEDMESTYEATAKRTLHLAYEAQGFVNGETFSDIQNPRRRFVLSKWRTARDWYAWFHSDARKGMMSELNLLLNDQEKISLLEN